MGAFSKADLLEIIGRPEASDNSPFATEASMGRWLGRSAVTLGRWRAMKCGPPFIRVAERIVIYPVEAARQWLADGLDPGGETREDVVRRLAVGNTARARQALAAKRASERPERRARSERASIAETRCEENGLTSAE
jgi:hypothetical protein